MSLTEAMVIDYLRKARSLSDINNHEVKDSEGSKLGQTPLTIGLGKRWIQELLDKLAERERDQDYLTEQEEALIYLQESLNSLPVALNIQALYALVTGLDVIQNNLFSSVNVYLNSVKDEDFGQNKMILKALVLVLKILEYDLSKKEGPITVGYSFFQRTVLTDEQRIDNLAKVKELLNNIIERFNGFFVTDNKVSQEHANSESESVLKFS